jgi:hypothetical protein
MHWMKKIIDKRLLAIPRIHREFLQTSVEKLKDDKRILGLHDRLNCLSAINAAINLYRDLRKELNQGEEIIPGKVELEAVKYLKDIEQNITKR